MPFGPARFRSCGEFRALRRAAPHADSSLQVFWDEAAGAALGGVSRSGHSGADEHFDAVVPVPLHWRKQWSRGFNQAELLARFVAKHRGIPVCNALRRKRATATQAGLANAGRRRNVAGAFVMRTNQKLAGKKILLIDDVMTTGATASACATALKRGGASSISLLTLARVDRRLGF